MAKRWVPGILVSMLLFVACAPAVGPDEALVVRVIDGDTIEVVQNGVTSTVRYIGIDTPETRREAEPYGEEATEANRRLVEGKIVRMERDISETDRFGRLLRYVYVDVDGQEVMVNAELVKLGFAVVSTYPPDVKYAELFLSLEREAREARRGLWGLEETVGVELTPIPSPTLTPTRAPTPSPTSSPAPVLTPTSTAISMLTPTPASFGTVEVAPYCSQFNAPGNDNENKIEEYICLVNFGAEVLDLQGWALMDETGFEGKSLFIYHFPDFSLQPQGLVRVRTGCGVDTATDLYWCKEGTAVWNNDEDTAYLFDATRTLVAHYSY